MKADWAKTKAAGFPLLTSETPGGHDGVSADWATWLIPQSALVDRALIPPGNLRKNS